MKFCRIVLAKTNYKLMPESNAHLLDKGCINVPVLQNIYKQYCEYKNFDSVMPIFYNEFYDLNNDIISYHDSDLIGFSLIRKYDEENVEALQFAWNYQNPKLRLGIESLKHECAFYKSLGFKYFYLGSADEYKNEINGFEILGKL